MPYFQTAVTSKRMIRKGPGWSYSLCLIEFFPDLTNFLKIDSADLAQNNQIKLFLFQWSYSYSLNYHQGPPCPTLLRPVGEPPLKWQPSFTSLITPCCTPMIVSGVDPDPKPLPLHLRVHDSPRDHHAPLSGGLQS
jgi:hypothetical protein